MVDVTKRAKGPAEPLALIGSALAIPAGLLPAYGMTSIIPPLDFARVCRNRCWTHCNRLYRNLVVRLVCGRRTHQPNLQVTG